MSSIKELIQKLASTSGIPSFELVEIAEQRGWISIRHANQLRNAWGADDEEFKIDSVAAQPLLIRIRHDILCGYIRDENHGA